MNLTVVLFVTSVGLSHDWLDYGDTYRMRLHRKAQSIEFSPNYNSDAKVLWKRDDPPAREDSRQKVMGAFYVMNNLTQKDSGSYTIRDRDQKALSTNTIMVTGEDPSLFLINFISFPGTTFCQHTVAVALFSWSFI